MKNKGFTLIELLAVIVILAIIALIATPIVLGIIEDARQSSREQSAEYIVNNVELAYSTAYMKSYAAVDGCEAKDAGAVPKTCHVLNEFKMDKADVNKTQKKITAEGITCTVNDASGSLTATCAFNDDLNTPIVSTSVSMELAK